MTALLTLLLSLGAALVGLVQWWRWGPALRLHQEGTYRLVLAALAAALLLAIVALVDRVASRRSARPRDAGVLLRSLFLLLTATCLTQVCLQPLFSPVHALASLGMCGGAFALLALLQPRLAPRTGSSGRGRRAFDFLVTTAGVTLVLAELALRLTAMWFPSPLLVDASERSQRYIAGQRAATGFGSLGNPPNSRGDNDEEYRGREAGERLVVVVGDSFSFCPVPRPLHYSMVCERALEDTQIYNLGVVGIGPPEYLHLLVNEVLPMRPDAIVISLFVGNDLVWPTPPTGSGGWLRPFFDRRRMLTFRLCDRLLRLRREREQAAVEAAAEGREGRDGVTFGGGVNTVEEAHRVFPSTLDPRSEVPTFSRATWLEIEAKRAREICTESSDLLAQVRPYLELLGQMTGDIPLFLMLIPDEFQVEDRLWEELRDGSEIELERDRAFAALRAWAEEEGKARGVDVLDLLPILRAADPLEDGDRHLYHRQDTHWNARGNEVAGRALAEFLKRKLPHP